MALNEKDITKACFLTYLIMSVNEESFFGLLLHISIVQRGLLNVLNDYTDEQIHKYEVPHEQEANAE